MRVQRLGAAQIAATLKRHRSTIYREGDAKGVRL